MQLFDSPSGLSSLDSNQSRPNSSRIWLRTAILPILMVAWWFTVPASATRALGYCDQVCEVDSKCSEPCLVNYDDPSTCGQYGTCWDSGYCGDGFCAILDGESVSNCSSDCFIGPGSTPPPDEPTCGNSVCEPGESDKNCSADCGDMTNSCGDGICVAGETFNNCSADCTYADWCGTNGFSCPSGYTCRANRCVYDPLAESCQGSLGGADCSGSNMRCTQVDQSTGYGVCVPFF